MAVALLLDTLFGSGVGFSNANNIQAFSNVIQICVLDFRIIAGSFVRVYVDCT